MIIVDTDVISEPLRKEPDRQVMAWLDRQDPASLFLTAITVRELEFGVRSMPDGNRRRRIHDAVMHLYDREFHDRILPFDKIAALQYGSAVPGARETGRTIMEADGMIAAIALCRDCAIATRDTIPFRSMGISQVLNPWTGETWTLHKDVEAERTDGPHSYSREIRDYRLDE